MKLRIRVVLAALVVALLVVPAASAWTVFQVATWTQIIRSNGMVGFVMPNGYHLYSDDPRWDDCMKDADDDEVFCQDGCDTDYPECPPVCSGHSNCVGECRDQGYRDTVYCNDRWPVLVNSGNDPSDGF